MSPPSTIRNYENWWVVVGSKRVKIRLQDHHLEDTVRRKIKLSTNTRTMRCRLPGSSNWAKHQSTSHHRSWLSEIMDIMSMMWSNWVKRQTTRPSPVSTIRRRDFSRDQIEQSTRTVRCRLPRPFEIKMKRVNRIKVSEDQTTRHHLPRPLGNYQCIPWLSQDQIEVNYKTNSWKVFFLPLAVLKPVFPCPAPKSHPSIPRIPIFVPFSLITFHACLFFIITSPS